MSTPSKPTRLRYFLAENNSQSFSDGVSSIWFQFCGSFAGVGRGIYATGHAGELRMLQNFPGMVREISEEDYLHYATFLLKSGTPLKQGPPAAAPLVEEEPKAEAKPERPSIMHVLKEWRDGGAAVSAPFARPAPAAPSHRYIHCAERHAQGHPEGEARILRAFQSWVTLYQNPRVTPCHVWHYPRSSHEMGDARGLPYLKDILIAGMTQAREGDVILLTNDDTLLHPRLVEGLDAMLRMTDVCGSMRLNFEPGQVPPLTLPIETMAAKGQHDLGRDLFAFRKGWLRSHWHEIPDFLLGELEWDLVMTVLLRGTFGIITNRVNILEPFPACELPYGYVMHETHARKWVDPAYKDAPAKLHNKRLSIEFYHEHRLLGMAPTF